MSDNTHDIKTTADELILRYRQDKENDVVKASASSVASVAHARDLSIQGRATEDDDVGGGWGNIFAHLVAAGELVAPWWSFRRDHDLRQFWKTSDHLSGAVFALTGRISTIDFKILPADSTIQRQVSLANDFQRSLLEDVEFGQGWNVFIGKWVEDLLTTDNGAFAEVIGAGRPDGPIIGRALSLAHLDSTRCTRTSNPEFPVIYFDDKTSKRYKLHYTRVIHGSQMPSPIVTMNNVGFCLAGDSSVFMADGTKRRIRDIVRDFSSDPVLSIDKNGEVVAKRVIGWHKNPRLGREMVNIRGEKAKLIQGRQERNSWVTEDHPILTPSGWVKAGNLSTGDKIVTGLPAPNQEQRYKIPNDDLPDYNPSLWEPGERAGVLIDTVVITRGDYAPRYVYCIDVEDTHNFITAGIAVHNCAVSRAINITQTLVDITRYKQEKMGSRPLRQMLVGTGVSAREIWTALAMAQEGMDNRGFARYAPTVVIANENKEIGIEQLDLASVPDGFDEQTATTLGMYAIALAFGVDARELWPATASGATKGDAMIQHLKSRGKGPGQIMQLVQRQINQKFLPPSLSFTFDMQDDEQDALRADIRDKRSIRHERDIADGAISIRVIRELMLSDGDITEAQFAQLELADGRLADGGPVLALFHDPDFSDLLTLPNISDPIDNYANDPSLILPLITSAFSNATKELILASTSNQKKHIEMALAALEALRELYEEPDMAEEEEDEEVSAPGQDDRGPDHGHEYDPEGSNETIERVSDGT